MTRMEAIIEVLGWAGSERGARMDYGGSDLTDREVDDVLAALGLGTLEIRRARQIDSECNVRREPV